MSDGFAADMQAALASIGTRPLLVVDVDEVVLRFVPPLERHLEAQGYRLDVVSFGLTGNVRRHGSQQAIAGAEVLALIGDFFACHVHDQEPVDGAVASLARLATALDVVLLTNAPAIHREVRRERLADLGIPYALIMNEGPKGPALAQLAAQVDRPIFFVDDGPSNLASVRDRVPEARLVHFVDDERYFRLAPDVPGTWLKTRDWGEVVARIEAAIGTGDPPGAATTGARPLGLP